MNPTARRRRDIRNTKLAKRAKPGQNPVRVVKIDRPPEEWRQMVGAAHRNEIRLIADEYRVGFQ